jgi:prepilin-type N-terminal cleavage/methylation domain-containing protein
MRALLPKASVAGDDRGLTLVELLVTVAIIGVVSSVLFTVSQGSWRRERANAATMELAGWLDQISRSSAKLGVSCRVTLNTGTLAPGAVLASVTPTNCATEANVQLPAINTNQNFLVSVSAGVSPFTTSTMSGPVSWNHTRRGTLSPRFRNGFPAGEAFLGVNVRISVAGQVPVRCLWVNMLGVQSMGRNNATGDVMMNCIDWSVR